MFLSVNLQHQMSKCYSILMVWLKFWYVKNKTSAQRTPIFKRAGERRIPGAKGQSDFSNWEDFRADHKALSL